VALGFRRYRMLVCPRDGLSADPRHEFQGCKSMHQADILDEVRKSGLRATVVASQCLIL